MGLEIQVGTPPVEGRYVVWTPCKALQIREWCEPSIASFHGGRWHSYEPVWGWIGPLPVVHGNDCSEKARAWHGVRSMNCDPSTADYLNATMLIFATFVVGYLVGWWMKGK
jgi:hypothetical protein